MIKLVIQRIIALLNEKELKKVDLCRYLGIGTSTMSTWQTRNTDPPTKYIISICKFLDVSPHYLLTGSEYEATKTIISESNQKALDTVQQSPEYTHYKDLSLTERIKEKATPLGYSFASIERAIGLSHGAIRRWDTSIPSADKLKAVADLLNCSMEYLLTGEDDNTKVSTITVDTDQKLFSLIHQLPEDVQKEYIAEIRGYIKALNQIN